MADLLRKLGFHLMIFHLLHLKIQRFWGLLNLIFYFFLKL